MSWGGTFRDSQLLCRMDAWCGNASLRRLLISPSCEGFDWPCHLPRAGVQDCLCSSPRWPCSRPQASLGYPHFVFLRWMCLWFGHIHGLLSGWGRGIESLLSSVITGVTTGFQNIPSRSVASPHGWVALALRPARVAPFCCVSQSLYIFSPFHTTQVPGHVTSSPLINVSPEPMCSVLRVLWRMGRPG